MADNKDGDDQNQDDNRLFVSLFQLLLAFRKPSLFVGRTGLGLNGFDSNTDGREKQETLNKLTMKNCFLLKKFNTGCVSKIWMVFSEKF